MENNHGKYNWRRLFQCKWNPSPLERPQVNPDLEEMDGLSRSAESIRYSILSIEFWISPNGQVREWLRHNTRLAIILGIPALLVLPILLVLLWQFAAILTKFIILPLLALILAAIVFTIVVLIRIVFRI